MPKVKGVARAHTQGGVGRQPVLGVVVVAGGGMGRHRNKGWEAWGGWGHAGTATNPHIQALPATVILSIPATVWG